MGRKCFVSGAILSRARILTVPDAHSPQPSPRNSPADVRCGKLSYSQRPTSQKPSKRDTPSEKVPARSIISTECPRNRRHAAFTKSRNTACTPLPNPRLVRSTSGIRFSVRGFGLELDWARVNVEARWKAKPNPRTLKRPPLNSPQDFISPMDQAATGNAQLADRFPCRLRCATDLLSHFQPTGLVPSI